MLRYEIVREKVFDEKIRLLCGSYRLMEDFDQAIDWYLSRAPRSEYLIGNDYYLWITRRMPYNSVPALRIVYHVDDIRQLVTIKDVTSTNSPIESDSN